MFLHSLKASENPGSSAYETKISWKKNPAGLGPGLICGAVSLNCVPGGLTHLEVDGDGDITERQKKV